jgi:D-alanyl-D-alanine carboxypeptidase (penicillin-binding protein 5/6)
MMSRELINKHSSITEFTTQWLRTFREGKKDKEVMLDNTNKLLRTYTGTIGLKTGFTQKAGYCLSSVVKRSNLMLISVVIGEPDSNTRFAETKKLMDYGFANYETKLVNNKGEQVQKLSVKKGINATVNATFGEDVKLLLKKGNKAEIQREINLNNDLIAPVKTGQKIGEIVYVLEGKEVGRAELLADRDIQRASFIRLFVNMISEWFDIGRR